MGSSEVYIKTVRQVYTSAVHGTNAGSIHTCLVQFGWEWFVTQHTSQSIVLIYVCLCQWCYANWGGMFLCVHVQRSYCCWSSDQSVESCRGNQLCVLFRSNYCFECVLCVGGRVLTFECMFWLLSVCFDLWVCIVYTHYRCICTYMHTYVHRCVVQYTPCPFTFRPSPHTYINAFTCILCKVCISTSCN